MIGLKRWPFCFVFLKKWRPARGRHSWRPAKVEIVCYWGHVCQFSRFWKKLNQQSLRSLTIGLYRDVWIAAIASATTSLATRTAAICVRFQGRHVRRVYVTMQITFLTRNSALIYRRGLRQRVASHTLNRPFPRSMRSQGKRPGRGSRQTGAVFEA